MNIAIIGYGKMGQAIARLVNPKHKLRLIIDTAQPDKRPSGVDFATNPTEADPKVINSIDVFFEFSSPLSAQKNITELLRVKKDAKIVCGTTGWDVKTVEEAVKLNKAYLLVSTNFSVGIKALKPCLEELSMSLYKKGFNASIIESHHKNKKDSPSGTAKTLAEIIKKVGFECPIKSIREDDHVGTHTIKFESEFETIEIKHEAKNRDVFCIGAIYSAEWLSEQQKPGVYFYL